MDESIVEGGKDVSDTEVKLAFCELGAEGDGLFLGCFDFLGRLSNRQHRAQSVETSESK
jgi:hypothetical protein